MGMVMYVRSGNPEQINGLLGDDAALFDWVTDESSWEADKMWWAALDLLFGPGGVSHLEGEPISEESGYTPVMRIGSAAAAALAASVADVDAPTVAERFDAGSFGDPLGPEVMSEDRDWLGSAALSLAELLRRASSNSHDLVWVVA
jgi:hypothetical protein